MATIVHTTDLGQDDGPAFVHGVALALASGSELISLHANDGADVTDRMRDATEVLLGWGHPADAVPFRKQVHTCCDDPVETVIDALRSIEPQLVLATTHTRSALARIFLGSGAEAIAHNVGAPVLLFPAGVAGFIGPSSGRLLRLRILVPVADADAAAVAVERAIWLGGLAGADGGELVLLHVGPPRGPAVRVPARPGWTVERHDVDASSLEAGILQRAGDASVVVMATRGHDSLGDVLRGSHTERVLHEASCPVLSVVV